MKMKRPKITKKLKFRIKMGVGLKKIHYSKTDSEQKFWTKLYQKPTQLLIETFWMNLILDLARLYPPIRLLLLIALHLNKVYRTEKCVTVSVIQANISFWYFFVLLNIKDTFDSIQGWGYPGQRIPNFQLTRVIIRNFKIRWPGSP